MVKAFFPGTFDPITLGHSDLVQRAARLFDELIVGVYAKDDKSTLFNADKRLEMAKTELADQTRVKVVVYSGLTVDAALRVGAKAIVRGLRIGGDFEYERGMALVNRGINASIETVCLMSSADYQHISSSRVKEIAELGGSITAMVSPQIAHAVSSQYTTL